MHLNWNILGVLCWIVVICLVAGIIFHTRQRHLKMIVVQKKHHSQMNWFLDIIEFLIALIAVGGMLYVTVLDRANAKDSQRITLNYEVQPLVMQTKSSQGYYVQAKGAADKNIIQYYTYWTHGAKYSVPSNNASVVDGDQSISLNAKNYPWPHTRKYDQKYQKAYVITMVAHYKNNWRNGLGMHVGSVATDYTLIRIPSNTFLQMLP
ncbi:LVIS_2131 family protein [Bombilactobacillus folatiphilus]|uniref:LVIS_2131 family protein n=1 Tax=Bombilactobacillus folatiphilus TaxID=2923362 RepID=A0ABY4P922_9LACO|nr:LVIS_2131 family protein [Bombilactobacillus folatiphilus]UQS82234.1 LVIS_2131 family protein [Bombilactobacillus folatiphilus]